MRQLDRKLSCFVFFSLLAVSVPHAWAKTGAPGKGLLDVGKGEQGPITITAQEAELDNKQHLATYRGQVNIQRSDMTITADKAVARFDPDTKRIQEIKAQGRVRIIQLQEEKKVEITADEAVYYDAEQKIVLTGNPVCNQGQNVLQGAAITYYMTDDRVVVDKADTKFYPPPQSKDTNAGQKGP